MSAVPMRSWPCANSRCRETVPLAPSSPAPTADPVAVRAQRHPLPEFGNGTELSQIVEALRTENDALRTQLIAAERRRAAGRTSIVPPPQQTSDEARAGAAASAGHAAPDAPAETARDVDDLKEELEFKMAN